MEDLENKQRLVTTTIVTLVLFIISYAAHSDDMISAMWLFIVLHAVSYLFNICHTIYLSIDENDLD